MDIEPEQVKTEPPEDAGLCEELEIELGPVKYENGQVPADRDSLKCGEVKVEPTLTVEHGMQLPSDMAGPAVTIKEEPQDLEEADDFAEPGDVDFEGVKIKNETAEPEEKEEEPVPSSSSGFRQWPCHHCGAAYKRKQSLSQHIRSHMISSDVFPPGFFYQRVEGGVGDSPEVTVFVCSLCEYTSVSLASVRIHFKYRHSTRKPYSCSLCDVRFKTKSDVRRHMICHSKKRLQCPHCSYSSGYSYKMNIHVHGHSQKKGFKRTHQKSEVANYGCTRCGLNFNSRLMLAIHKGNSHPHHYTCHICNYTTVSRYLMIAHTKRHMAAPTHKCKFCPQVYQSLGSFKNHVSKYHQDGKKLQFFSMDQL